jgi:hypothetical protein
MCYTPAMNPFAAMGKAIGRFFAAVAKSCYDMEFYRGVRQRPWTSSLRYLIAFAAALVLFAALTLAPTMIGAPGALVAHLQGRFPDGASVTIKNGVLTTNLPMPFAAGTPDFPVTIDTSVTGRDFPPSLDSEGLFVGRDAIFAYGGKTDQRVYPMSDMPDLSLTKEQAVAALRSWGTPAMLSALAAFIVAYWLALVLSSVIYVAVAVLLALLLGRLWGVRMSYGRWFASGLHAVTLPILVNLLTSAAGLQLSFAYTFIFFMIMAAIIADERNQPTREGAALLPEETPRRPLTRVAPPPPPAPRMEERPASRPAPPAPASEAPAEPPAKPKRVRKTPAAPRKPRAPRKKPAPPAPPAENA